MIVGQVIIGRALAEHPSEGLAKWKTNHLGRVTLNHFGRARIAVKNRAFGIMDQYPFTHGIEGLLPDSLSGCDRLDEALAVQHHGGHLCKIFEQSLLVFTELMRPAIAGGQGACVISDYPQRGDSQVAYTFGNMRRKIIRRKFRPRSNALDNSDSVLLDRAPSDRTSQSRKYRL